MPTPVTKEQVEWMMVRHIATAHMDKQDDHMSERAVWEQSVYALLRSNYLSGEAATIADYVVNEWRKRFRPQETSADVSPQAEPIWKDCVNCKTPLKRGPCSVCGAVESENWEVKL